MQHIADVDFVFGTMITSHLMVYMYIKQVQMAASPLNWFTLAMGFMCGWCSRLIIRWTGDVSSDRDGTRHTLGPHLGRFTYISPSHSRPFPSGRCQPGSGPSKEMAFHTNLRSESLV